MTPIKFYRIAAAVTFLLLSVAPFSLGQANDLKNIPIPPLHKFKPQDPRRVELPNGMVIFLQEDHELPLMEGRILIRGGGREEPSNKLGLVELYGETWRIGGSRARTGDQLDDFLEARAAKVETSGDMDSTSISWSCLKGDIDEVLNVVLELLQQPAFREDKLAIAKAELNTGISRRNDNLNGIANREATRIAYGPNNPYARQPEYYTVAAVTRQDLLDWHKTYVHPNNMILGISGDFDLRAMEANLQRIFSVMPRGPQIKTANIEFHDPKPGVYFIPKDDVNQSAIRMVYLGTRKDNPDYYAIEVLDEIFGGGFSSRLFSNLRSKKGLAYSVGGGLGTAYDHPGLFRLVMGTKSQTTAESLEGLFSEVEDLDRKPASQEELKSAKDAILTSFVFNFDSKDKVLNERMRYEFYGYPPDFLEKYPAGITAVTAADVARVVKKYVDRKKLAVLVVGKQSDFDRPLSTFGPVTNVDITIPETAPAAPHSSQTPAVSSPPAPSSAARTAENTAPEKLPAAPSSIAASPLQSPAGAATALMAKILADLGGQAKVMSIKSVRQKAKIVAETPTGEINLDTEALIVYPDTVYRKIKSPMGEMTTVVAPGISFMKMGAAEPRDIPASGKDEMMKDLKRDPIFITQHVNDPTFSAQVSGSEKIGDIETTILEVRNQGVEAKWFVDPTTGHILRISSRSGPNEQVIDLSNYRVVQGVAVAFSRVLSSNGKTAGKAELTEVQFNPAIDRKLFERPN